MMKSGYVLTVGILAVLLVATWMFQPGQAQTSADADLKIAVVNVADVLMQSQEKIDREKENLEKRKKIQTELQQLSSEAKNIEEELKNVLEPGTPEYSRKMEEWFEKQARAQTLDKMQSEILAMESQVWAEGFYDKMLDEVKRIAQLEGYTLVINKDEIDSQSRNFSDLLNMMVNRKVLYNAPTIDITAQVLENLDKAYQREKNS